MKVLTIREPWASLIGEQIKIIETRSWPTNYRGELYIHAGVAPIPKTDERMKELPMILKNSLHFGTISQTAFPLPKSMMIEFVKRILSIISGATTQKEDMRGF